MTPRPEDPDTPKNKKKSYEPRNKVKSKLKNIDMDNWEEFIEDSFKGDTNARDDDE